MRLAFLIAASIGSVFAQGVAEKLTFDITPRPLEAKNKMVLTVTGKSFPKTEVYPSGVPALSSDPVVLLVHSYLKMAALGDKDQLLKFWHSGEQGRAAKLYADEKLFERLVTAARSMDKNFVLAAVDYGESYVLAIILQRYKDGTLKAVVLPFREDSRQWRLSNDLTADPAFALAGTVIANQLKDRFLRAFPEIVQ